MLNIFDGPGDLVGSEFRRRHPGVLEPLFHEDIDRRLGTINDGETRMHRPRIQISISFKVGPKNRISLYWFNHEALPVISSIILGGICWRSARVNKGKIGFTTSTIRVQVNEECRGLVVATAVFIAEPFRMRIIMCFELLRLIVFDKPGMVIIVVVQKPSKIYRTLSDTGYSRVRLW